MLIFLLALAGWRLNREKNRSHELAAKIEGLPPGIKQTITIYKDRVVTKWRDGRTKIVYQDRYLPPEGRVEIAIKDDKPDTPSEIFIKDRGFTRRIGGGFVYTGEPLPLIDLKCAYWRRYSLMIGITPAFGGIGISRHVDDFLPFRNMEMLGLLGLDWEGRSKIGMGVRLNF
ncbi:MAG: hypothetical protein HY547_02835 [Elusimicrobia bacterium]|nr:hypothetical protein [Elusimicrobiota bacterium]